MSDTIDPVSTLKLVFWAHMGSPIVAHEWGYSFPCTAGDCARDDRSMCVGFGPGLLHKGLQCLAELAKNK